MSKITADQIRKLKEDTGAPVMRVKSVLEQFNGDEKKAKELLDKEGFEKAAKRQERETTQGKIFTYQHHTGRVVGVAEVLCETDFVARNEVFEGLGRDIAMQVASMGDKNINDQEFIKDPSKKMSDLVKGVTAKTGENIKIGRVFKIVLGEK